MSKKLYILRHAQKDESSNIDDYERTLTAKGCEDAKNMAQDLLKKDIYIDSILASPATRTRQTAEIFAKELGYTKNIVYNQALYMGFVNEIKEVISYTYDEVESLLLVGHNPGVSALGITLTEDFRKDMKMGSILSLEFDCNSWLDISKSNARFISYECPEE